MARSIADFYVYFNEEEQEALVEKFGTTEKKELNKLMKKAILSQSENSETINPLNNSDQQTTKAELELVKLRNETVKTWKNFVSVGGNPNDFVEFIKNGSIPYVEDSIFSNDTAINDDTEKPKPVLTFGTTIRHTPKKIKQDDGTLRCLHCSRAIPMRGFDFEQLDDYRKHVESTHGRLDEAERTQLMEIYPR